MFLYRHSQPPDRQHGQGAQSRYAINPAKLAAELGWQPQVDFTTGLKNLITWYVEHRPWWERVKSGEYREYAKMWYGALSG